MTRILYKANRTALYSLRTWHVRHHPALKAWLAYLMYAVAFIGLLSLFYCAASIVFTHEEVVSKLEEDNTECFDVLNGRKLRDDDGKLGKIEWSEVKPLVGE